MQASVDTDARPITIAATLQAMTVALESAGVSTARLDAELLLAAACDVDRSGLYMRAREPLSESCGTIVTSLLARRVAREPLQYIVGRQEFWSLDFIVTPDVLIPRPETELLVELVLRMVGSSPSLPRRGLGGGASRLFAQPPLDPLLGKEETLAICDLGTGSGCIAIALAREAPSAEVWGLDVSSAALHVAASNARRHGVADRLRLVESNVFSAIGNQRFDVIVSNPPYVASSDIAAQPELAFEPRRALDGGASGLDRIWEIVAAAPTHLVDGGRLFMEIGASQAAAVVSLARQAGAREVAIRPDYAGLPRVLQARW